MMSLEILQVAEAVAREKNINKEDVLVAMEEAFQMAARRKFGMHWHVQAVINRMEGTVELKQLKEVVETVMEPVSSDEFRMAAREGRDPNMQPAKDAKGKPLSENDMQITLAAAKKSNKDIEIGEYVVYDLPPMDFGRVAAQAAKQVIVQKVREAERGKEFEEYKEDSDKIVSGIVKRIDYKGILVDLGRAEAFLPKEELINREFYRQNDRIRAYVMKVERQERGPQILLSRTHPNFLIKLFEEEVPEIGNGTIEIVGAARDAGFRAKIAVKSGDQNLDPVGACVGIRGSRVQAVTQELQGERIDIINWSSDPATFLVRALAPAEVTKVVMDEAENRIEVVVPEDKLSLAIGRRGQNVRLASQLTGWNIDIMSEEEESEKRKADFERISARFVEALDVDETLTNLLISEGFTKVEELLMVPTEELAAIDGLDEAIATELQNRAQAFLDEAAIKAKKLGIEKALVELDGMSMNILMLLADKGIKKLDDLAELATDELIEELGADVIKEKEAEDLIMAARKHWFDAEDAAAAKKSKAS